MWSLGGIRIFVTSWKRNRKVANARLNVLGGGTVIQNFGYEFPVVNVSAKVVGLTDTAALDAMAITGSGYVMSGPTGAMGTFIINDLNYTWDEGICQTLRPDLAEDSPVFTTDLELYRDS